MKPTDLNGKIVLFQDEDKKWWNTKLHIEKIEKVAEYFDEELKKNMAKFEYILGYQGRYGKHCVYVKAYDRRKKLAVCINSYGKENPNPRIKIEDIENLYRVRCTAVVAGTFISNSLYCVCPTLNTIDCKENLFFRW